MRTPRLGVLLSGTGRTLENFLQRIRDGRFDGQIVVVVSSVPGVRGIEVARESGIPTHIVQRSEYESDSEFSAVIYDTVGPYDPDLLLLAGFLRRLVVPEKWESRILNIHPAILPEMRYASGKGMYGDRVHAAVLQHGETRSGATVHVVDNHYDRGEIVAKETVPIYPEDEVKDLSQRVFEIECELYPGAVASYLEAHPEIWTR